MARLYLLDTNICIYLIRGRQPALIRRITRQERGTVSMSCLTLAELRHGVEKQADARTRKSDGAALDALIEEIPAMPFDARAAQAFGVLAATGKLRRNQAIDNLIAAHAIALDAVLVTNNERDFKGYPGVPVENWALV